MNILIRTARADEAHSLKEFYKIAYPNYWHYKVDEFWQWLYQDATNVKDGETTLYIAVDEENNRIAGQSGVFTQQFSFKSKIFNVAWGSDLFVLPEYRGNQIAQKLHTRIRDDFDFYIAVSYAFSTGKMLKRIGGIELNPVNTYVLPLKMSKSESYKAFNRHMKQFTIGKSFKLIYESKIFRTLYINSGFWKLINVNFKNKIPSSQQVNLKQSDDSASFYKNLEQLSNFQSNSFDAFPIFDRKQSEWRFFKHPKKQHHFAYINNENEKISGIAIYRITNHPEGNYAIISGLYADKKENYKKLLMALIDKLTTSDPTAIFLCKGTSSYSFPINKLGFMHITKRIPIIIPRDRNNIKLINNIKTWDFNFESQDLDFYPNFRLL